jgi:hypothetical protein
MARLSAPEWVVARLEQQLQKMQCRVYKHMDMHGYPFSRRSIIIGWRTTPR